MKNSRMNAIINFFALFLTSIKRNSFKMIILGSGIFFASFFFILSSNLSFSLKNFFYQLLQNKIPIHEIYLKLDDGNKDFFFKNFKKEDWYNNLLSELKNLHAIEKVISILKPNIPVLLSLSLNDNKLKNKEGLFIQISVIGLPEADIPFFILKEHKEYINYLKEYPKGFQIYNNKIPFLIPYLAYFLIDDFMKNNQLENFEIFDFLKSLNYTMQFNRSFLGNIGSASKNKVNTLYNLSGFQPISFLKESFPFLDIVVPKDQLEQVLMKVYKNHKHLLQDVLIPEFFYLRLDPTQLGDDFHNKLEKIKTNYNLKPIDQSKYEKIQSYIIQNLNFLDFVLYGFLTFIVIIVSLSIFYGLSYFFMQRNNEIKLYEFWGAQKYQIFLLLFLENLFMSILAVMLSYVLVALIFHYYLIDLFVSFSAFIPKILTQNQNWIKEISNAIYFQYYENFIKALISILYSATLSIVITLYRLYFYKKN